MTHESGCRVARPARHETHPIQAARWSSWWRPPSTGKPATPPMRGGGVLHAGWDPLPSYVVEVSKESQTHLRQVRPS